MLFRAFIYIVSIIFSYDASYAEESAEKANVEDNLRYIDNYLNNSQESKEENYKYFIVLKGLNKITGHVLTLHSHINKGVKFGNLEITPKICWKSSPEDLPENKALLEIFETKPSGLKERIFYGWMFSSSPSISSLEHALYDITLLECNN
jgi:hypothetical protein